MREDTIIHPTADISPAAMIGPGARIWRQVHIREGARIGANCILGKNVFIDFEVTLGDNVKIQNNASLYNPLVVEDGVFIGPHVVFTNDQAPRAINPDGTLKAAEDWEALQTRVCYGASIGAGAIILPGRTIGAWTLIGAGSVVTRDVPDRAIVVGNPARRIGYACDCGRRLVEEPDAVHRCGHCGRTYQID